MICRILSCFALAIIVMSGSVSAQSANGPETGTTVDEFALQDQNGTSHKFSDLLAKGPVALIVYRSADW